MNVNFVLSGIRHGSVHCVLQVDYIDMQEEPVIGSFLQKQFDKRTGSVISAEEWFFYGLIGTEMHEVEIDGKKYNRSKGWNTYYWGNSNRNPYTWNPKESPYHILDMSWTALLMLRWYDELEKDARLLAYAEDYAMALLGIQYENGFSLAGLT